MVAIFGEPDPLTGSSSDGTRSALTSSAVESAEEENGGAANNANPFPEPEIDDIRSLKDAELVRYIQVNLIISSSATMKIDNINALIIVF